MATWTIVSKSARRTMSLGRKLGKLVQGGEIIGLIGELGTGKTCFVRGFSAGVEVSKDAWVRSPTFTLINEYSGRLPVYHIDLYRVSGSGQQEGLNLREYLYGDGVTLVEWFDYLPGDEVDECLQISLTHRGGSKRELKFAARGERYELLLRKLRVETTK